jgi:hypothetical protein
MERECEEEYAASSDEHQLSVHAHLYGNDRASAGSRTIRQFPSESAHAGHEIWSGSQRE